MMGGSLSEIYPRSIPRNGKRAGTHIFPLLCLWVSYQPLPCRCTPATHPGACEASREAAIGSRAETVTTKEPRHLPPVPPVTCGFLEVCTADPRGVSVGISSDGFCTSSHASRLYAEQQAFHPEVRCRGGWGWGGIGTETRRN